MYRLTHNKVELVSSGDSKQVEAAEDVSSAINVSSLVMFSAVLFMTEFRKMGMADTDVSKTCNMSEWRRRLYSGTEEQEADEDVDIMELPAKDASKSGVIYAMTITSSTQEEEKKESIAAFLFACHKPRMAKTMPASRNASVASSTEPSQEIQALAESKGVTHIWLCGADPSQRRHGYMARCLQQLEADVLEWKLSGQGSGLITVHTIPVAFPGMVQFLSRNGFQGGDLVIGGESGKVMYWKAV
ncbi:hypothetical protein BG004_002618 [Podila humilis]|nr:hypothetical protein BG004_002618 [Podila humilis]